MAGKTWCPLYRTDIVTDRMRAVIVALVKMNPVDVYRAIWDGAMRQNAVCG